MNPTTGTQPRRQHPPILDGVLAVGAFLAIIATGWTGCSARLRAPCHLGQPAAASGPDPRSAGRAPGRRTSEPGRARMRRCSTPSRRAAARGLGLGGRRRDRDRRGGPVHHHALEPGPPSSSKARATSFAGSVADKDEIDGRRWRRRSVRAAYLTYYGVADKDHPRARARAGRAHRAQRGGHRRQGRSGPDPLSHLGAAALDAGAQGPVIIKDFEGHSPPGRRGHLHHRPDRGLQGQRARQRPARLAIIDTRTGKPWIDNEKLAWVDPFREEDWDYNIAIAKEAVAKGFDEVQFDYVRFPTDGKLSAAASYSQPNNAATRLPAIAGFLAKARRELGPTGVFLGADVFGYTAFNDNDTDIGQRIEELSAAPRLHLPHGLPVGLSPGHPRRPESGRSTPTRSSRRASG